MLDVAISVSIDGKLILEDISFSLNEGELLVIFGPNGSGKTTLLRAIMGDPNVKVEGTIRFQGENITELPMEKRFEKGIFLAFQIPPTIPIKTKSLIYAIYNKLEGNDLTSIPKKEFLDKLYNLMESFGLKKDLLEKDLFDGFSGGEKKKLEVILGYLFGKKLVLLDEPDSGMDIHGIKQLSNILKKMKEERRGIILVTHNLENLKEIDPDRIIYIKSGKIVGKFDNLSKFLDYIKNEGNK